MPASGGTRLLRRVGGLRRLIILVGLTLIGLYALQSLFLSHSGNKRQQEHRRPKQSSSYSAAPPQPVSPKSERETAESPHDRHLAGKHIGELTGKEVKAAGGESLGNAAVPSTRPPTNGCGISCSSTELSFNVEAALSDSQKPTICLNNLLILDSSKVTKGFNVVIIDEKTKTVQDVKYFDMLTSDREFVGFMSHLTEQRVILIASWGDVAEKVTSDSRELLQKFGSARISDFKRGNSLVMVGQRGLKSDSVVEDIGVVTEKETNAFSSVRGCLKLPMGQIDEDVSLLNQRENPPEVVNPGQNIRRGDVIYGDELPHCGLKNACPSDHFAFSAYSGKNKDDQPKVCVNGRFVIGRNLNKAGRGLNIVVLNATEKDVLRVGHFDTYAEDSSTLEIFLEQMTFGETIIVVSFDEASTRLSSMAKQMFYELGSGLVQNLKFRASWYFIGQKGIVGFSPFEELNFASGSEWAKAVDLKTCVPSRLDGMKTRPDPVVYAKNDKKRHFCAKYDGYEDFCDETNIDNPLTPAPLVNKSRGGDPIFQVPILIIAGLSHNSLRLCLETVLRQEGVNVNMVLVTYDENYPEGGALGQLFGFKTLAINASASYMSQYAKSLEAAWDTFSATKELIIVEEELLLASDFLYFFAQTLKILQNDPTLISVSAWNDNGFVESASRTDLAYRIEDGFPSAGYMIRRQTYDALLAGKLEQCCSRTAWEGWNVERHVRLVPDTPRLLRRHSDGLGVLKPSLEDLFHRERAFSKDAVRLSNAAWLSSAESYDKSIVADLSRSAPIPASIFRSCSTDGKKSLPQLPVDRPSLVVVAEQSSSSDLTELRGLAKCFGAYHSSGQNPRGLYKGILRFSYEKRPVFLVGNKSPFFTAIQLEPSDFLLEKKPGQTNLNKETDPEAAKRMDKSAA